MIRQLCLTVGLMLAAFPTISGADMWRIGMIGDTPYNRFERQELPKLMNAIADTHVDILVHIGDIKDGQERCDDSLFEDRQRLFNSSRVPFIFVPGDNEWTDCERISNGSFDPVERLEKLRSLFWSSSRSLGQSPVTLEQQPGPYREHARLRLGPALLVTLNVPGWDNNRGMAQAPRAEYLNRNPQVLAWVREGFALARQEKRTLLIFAMQANPGFKRFNEGNGEAGFRDLLQLLRQETALFPGQVVMLHGDTHHHQIDQPLRDADGKILNNFTRVESYGSPFMGWVRMVIDTDGERPFRFESHPWPPRQ